jgi:YD repeat-containing protein
MTRPHFSHTSRFIRLICFLVCYSLVIPLPAFTLRSVSIASAAAHAESPVKTKNIPLKANQTSQKARWRDGELLMHFREHAPISKLNQLLTANGAQWNGQLRGESHIERLRLSVGSDPEAVAATLRTSDLVDFIEPNYLITADQSTPQPEPQTIPNDPRYPEQWGVKNTVSSEVWAATAGSKQTVIAVIDSGIDFTHPDLSKNEWDNSLEQANNLDNDDNGFNSDLHGWDFVVNSAGIIDEQGHGTAIAGIIAAEGNNATGISGVMWRASLMSLRVLDNTGTGDIAHAVEAIDYAVENGAQVINCAWGLDEDSLALHRAINRAAQHGVVVVTPAGNDNRDIETTPRYPASFDLPNLISVASTDNTDQLASFSNWGMTHISIAAPGKDILTTQMGGDYQSISGTSASTAFVAGVAGLVKTLRPWLNAERTREMILRGARQVPALSDKVAAKGIVSAAGSLETLNTLPPNEGLGETSDNNGGEHGNNGNGRNNQRGNRPGASNKGNNNSNRHRDGHEFTVAPLPRTQGAPSTGLPNLDELRSQQPTTPKAAPPIPSTRCSHHDLDCRSHKRQAAISTPADLLAWSASLPTMETLFGDNSLPLSDTPFKLVWIPRPLLAALPPPQPQTTRTNVALTSNGSVASASSTYSASYPASAAINGDRKGTPPSNGGLWHSAAPGNIFPEWLQIDFQASKTIDEIDVFTIQDNYTNPSEPTQAMTFNLYGLTGYEVQYWDGSNWAVVPWGSVSGNNLVWRKFTFSAITTSKIRVQTNASPDGYSRITEIEAYGTDAVPRANVARTSNGGAASASSTYSPGPYAASKANDGDRRGSNGELWHDTSPGNTFPDWLQIDFNGSKSIDEIDVFTIQDNYTNPSEPTDSMTFSLYGLTGYDVQYWNGSAWIGVPGGSVSGNNKVWRKFSFSALTTSKIRVLTNASVDGYSRITEVEAWGVPAGSVSDPSGNNYSVARLDPANRTGSAGVDLLSGNSNWSLPVLGLKGRAGLDLGLSLSYNSLVWTKSQDGISIKFDADRGFPGPGFRLGFPVIQPRYYNSQVGQNAYLLITPSGGRAELRQVGTSNTYESADSSYLQLKENADGSLTLRPTDGSQFTYILSNSEYKCAQVKDSNGNYISVSYYTDGRINTITDTLSRAINFNYDAYLNLNSITQTWGGVTHTWVNFGWSTQTVNIGFTGMTIVGPQNGTNIPVLTQVSLDDGSRYNFEYNSYAQVSRVRHYAFDNHQRSYSSYTLPASSTDCPRVTESREWVENWNSNQEATTAYSAPGDYSSGQVTMPDGTIYKELFATTGWQRGLKTGTEYWSGGVKKKWTTTAYTQDDTNLSFQKNPRVAETNIYDIEGNRKRTTVDYGPGSGPGNGQYAQYGLPYVIAEYAADGITKLRETYTDYNLSQAYLDRRIIGLVSAVHISNGSQWQTKIGYFYDAAGDQLQATTSPATQHDAAYGTGLTTRGNVTSIARYDVTDINNDSKRLITQIGYDTDGSAIFSRDPLNHQTSISYADSFSDNVNRNTFAYPTTSTDADSYSSTTQYAYSFGAVTRTQTPPPAGQTQGPILTMQYDAAGRISRMDNLSNGAWKFWAYPDRQDAVQSLTTINSAATPYYQITVVDGAGRLRAQGGDLPNSAGLYRGQFTYYDVMGRVSQTSNPAEMTSVWTPTGDDAAGWVWTQQAYDWKGRPTLTTLPSTNGGQSSPTKLITYGGCGCAGGEVVTLRDEIGRYQRMTADALGRTYKTEILNWDGSVYSTSTNNFDARDQVTSVVEQGASGASQTTNLTYDGYGRLKEQQASAQTSPAKYVYNPDDTVYKVTDARGVETTFAYNNRHLITGINYSSPPGITQTLPVFLSYDAAGNRSSLVDGSGSKSYQYDQLSRLSSETRQFTGLSGSYTLSYGYNLGGELTSVTDPTGASISYGYDQTGRMTGVTGTSFAGVTSYASNLQYRAWGALKSASIGDGTTLSASYNSRLLPTDFSISSTISKHYDYNADGRLRYSRNNGAGMFDRSYTYDHVGRVTEATSGPQARGEADTDTRPYNLSYGYDEMSHLSQSGGRVWETPHETNTGSGIYVNGKNTGWQYDADGRLINSGETQYSFDAAGRATNVVSLDGDLQQTQVFDSLGERTKLSSQQVTHNQNGTTTTETKAQYFVTSSVMNQVVTELDESGAKTRTFVYQGSEVLGWQQQSGSAQTMAWEHRDVSNASVRLPGAVDSSGGAELEPMGMDAGAFHLIAPPPPNYRPPLVQARTYPGFADMLLGSQCRVDGIDMPCGMAGSEATVACPNNDCGPQVINGELIPFIAYDDGSTSFDHARETIGYYPDGIPKGLRKTRRRSDGFFDHEYNPQKSPLSGKRLENYDKQRDKARVGLQSPKCREFLIAHGIDPDSLLNALNMQRAYDGLTSTISRGDAGFYRNEGVLESPLLAAERNRTVESYFNKVPSGYKRGAVTGTYPGSVGMINNTSVADRSDVYYGKGGINSATILHEALHSYTGYSDSLLQFILGIPIQDSTNNISDVLKKNGCAGK